MAYREEKYYINYFDNATGVLFKFVINVVLI